MTINLKQVIDAVKSVSEAYTALYDTQTGKTVYLREIAIRWYIGAGIEYMIFMYFHANLRVLLGKQKKKYNLLQLSLWALIWYRSHHLETICE